MDVLSDAHSIYFKVLLLDLYDWISSVLQNKNFFFHQFYLTIYKNQSNFENHVKKDSSVAGRIFDEMQPRPFIYLLINVYFIMV